MRLDKFLKVSRILKRRTVANDACSGGKVYVNDKQAKPSAQIKVGDVVSVRFAKGELKFRILVISETVRKEQAENMYEVIQ
ncbi:MAG: RNA-binding S4 domain-containing protein [Clostridia bacterium]|nr:RNA-binding S4 domain-containing protein [Clostridia bacterium]